MIKNKLITIELSKSMLFKILDGLESRVQAWEDTHQYLKTGLVNEFSTIEECDNEFEAQKISDDYRQIIGTITNQLNVYKFIIK